MRIVCALLCALGVLAVTGRVDAQTLYGATAAGGSGQLYTIDAATGAIVQNIGPLNDSLSQNWPITGLAFHPFTGVLYGSSGNAIPGREARLVTINPANGLVTVIGSFDAGPVNTSGTPATMADIAFDSAGNLYGVGSIGGPQIYSINILTGKATVIGSTGLTSTSGGGLAISSAGIFYGTPTASRFGTYNSTTGAYTDIGNPTKPAGGAYGALDFNGSGVLYGLNVGSGAPPPTHLVTINPANAAVTDLGASVTSLDAIAFSVVVPEPATLSLLVSGLVLVLLTSGRRNG